MKHQTHIIRFQGRDIECRESETVLQAFLRQSVPLSFSCASGVCHICMLRCLRGDIPELSQNGISPELKTKNYFLPCRCLPESDMELASPRESDLYIRATITDKQMVHDNLARIFLEPARAFEFYPGQFIHIKRKDGLFRSYSIASAPGQQILELHVKRISNGVFSNWLLDDLQTGDGVDIQGPQGDNHYDCRDLDQPMLLIGTGTGLAPLAGIIKHALHLGHRGPMVLYHGSSGRDGIYLEDELLELAQRHRQFHYHRCLSRQTAPAGYLQGRAHELALAEHPLLADWKIHLCGVPSMVEAATAGALAAGAVANNIHSDPFEFDHQQKQSMEFREEEKSYPPPDPELWQALKDGLLSRILTDFYTRVYKDPRLSPFFEGVTLERAIGKQYNFLCQVFTGENVYFGDRPRNAHHWMVISDELFDYREDLMESCQRRQGLAEPLIRRWRTMEESYRKQIVKSRPWKKIVDGIEFPLEGYDQIQLCHGTLCDSCHRPVDPGELVSFHVRLGKVYCDQCRQVDLPASDSAA